MKKLCLLSVIISCVLLAEQLTIPTLEMPSLNISQLKIPSVEKELAVGSRFVDTRNIFSDNNFLADTDSAQSWIKIYDEYATYPEIDYITIAEPFKMIAEVFVPQNGNYIILGQNLAYYKEQGFDSVLFCFTGNESLQDIQQCLDFLTASNLKIWAVYTKNGNLSCSVFDISAQRYEQILTMIAPYLTGYINSWKRTSVHLFKQDVAFMNFTNHTLRNVYPNIYLVGEFYYGEVYGINFTQYKIRPRIAIDFGQNMFPNASGCMIVNYGTLYTDFDYLFSNVLKNQIKQQTKFIGLVSARQNKRVIEQYFIKQGCIGTIMLPGSNEEFNLSKQRMEER